jgi:hypothetical protein
MATTIKLKLTLLFKQPVNDSAGSWLYVGANGVEETKGRNVQLIATERVMTAGSSSFPASMLTATIMFPARAKGGVPENITLQGIHDLTTNNETGSVSAASPEFADQIGGTFAFDSTKGVLTISPPR